MDNFSNDLVRSYSPGGTNFGDGTRTGDFSDIYPTVKGQTYPIQSPSFLYKSSFSASQAIGGVGAFVGQAMTSIISPTTIPQLFPLKTIPASSTGYVDLSSPLDIPTGVKPYTIKYINGEKIVELDYARPITITGEEPFVVTCSGYDSLGQKNVVQGTAQPYVINSVTVYIYTTVRCFKYMTAIKVKNLSTVLPTDITVSLKNMVELPYNDLGRQSNLLLWSMSANDNTNKLKPRVFQLDGSGNVNFFQGVAGGYFDSLPYSYLPASWDQTNYPLTLTTGNPRPIINIENNPNVSFSVAGDTMPIMNVFVQNVYGYGNETKTNFKFGQYNELTFGHKNYVDSNWESFRYA